MSEATTFDRQVLGKHHRFYGVCGNQFKLGAKVWEAVEDENDGYRSCMEELKEVQNSTGIFFGAPIATVIVRKFEGGSVGDYDEFHGYEFIDIKNGHTWLFVGTDEYDDYYPCFVFSYHAKEAHHE